MNVIIWDEPHTPTSPRPQVVTSGPTHVMAKRLDNTTSHTVRRGHIEGAEFAMLAQYHVVMITWVSTYVSNRHPLPPPI